MTGLLSFQDVCAGFCLLQEAGGVVFQGSAPTSLQLPLPEAGLGDRLYLAIRACSPTADETARDAQERVARAVWDRVELLNYTRLN
jgi:myo-inositol-1(or 4)-monophosphatase